MKRPYIRQKSGTKFIAIFNTENRDFATQMVNYCHSNGIGCSLERETPTGHLRYLVDGRSSQIQDVKDYIKSAYVEFCYYKKQVDKYIE